MDALLASMASELMSLSSRVAAPLAVALLVAGPATNLSTLLVLGREMSLRYAATYVTAVALYVLLASLILTLIP